MDKLREETAEHPEFQDWEESADGMSTKNVSSVGTPVPQQPKSGFKLKLNGSRAANGQTSSRGGTESAMQSDEE